ncbi:uncharacterized [Tachysurus ichikawai]
MKLEMRTFLLALRIRLRVNTRGTCRAAPWSGRVKKFELEIPRVQPDYLTNLKWMMRASHKISMKVLPPHSLWVNTGAFPYCLAPVNPVIDDWDVRRFS